MRHLAPYAGPHWRWFVMGAVCALCVVGAKLSLPWPLRAVAEHLTGDHSAGGLIALVPTWLDPIITLGGIFLLLVVSLGLSDFLERLCFGRFSSKTVNSVRVQVLESVSGTQAPVADTRDLVTRLIGDAGRIKSGLRLFLVHVATSGVLLLGMTVILFRMDWKLGLIFALAVLATLAVTFWAAAETLQISLQRRHKEGEYAERVRQAVHGAAGAPLKNGDRSDARQTKLQGIATLSTQGIFGVAVLTALWAGSRTVQAGTMAPGDMVVFMMYALMLQSPIVRLTRQGTRTGKIVGASYRLLQLVTTRERNPK